MAGLNITSCRLAIAMLLVASCGCSVRKIATKSVADSLAGSGSVFASDDDPDLIKDAAPFSLKLMETVLQDQPDHEGLLLATSSGFAQYSYAFVQQEADEVEPRDLSAATALRQRAKKLYIRARNYGLRGLDVQHSGFSKRVRKDPKSAVASMTRQDVPLLYWTAATWGGAISLSKNEPDLIADQLIVEAMMDRALALNPSFDDGAIQTFMITYEMARQGAGADSAARAKKSFDDAVCLTGGKSAAPYVSYAEAVCVQQQKKAEFEVLLKQALAVNVDDRPDWRLMNLIMQRRARWLLSRTDELFVE